LSSFMDMKLPISKVLPASMPCIIGSCIVFLRPIILIMSLHWLAQVA
jgi:hypothetical protein